MTKKIPRFGKIKDLSVTDLLSIELFASRGIRRGASRINRFDVVRPPGPNPTVTPLWGKAYQPFSG